MHPITPQVSARGVSRCAAMSGLTRGNGYEAGLLDDFGHRNALFSMFASLAAASAAWLRATFRAFVSYSRVRNTALGPVPTGAA